MKRTPGFNFGSEHAGSGLGFEVSFPVESLTKIIGLVSLPDLLPMRSLEQALQASTAGETRCSDRPTPAAIGQGADEHITDGVRIDSMNLAKDMPTLGIM